MIRELVAAASMVVAACPLVFAVDVPGPYPPRIIETFDGFPDGYELRNDYPTFNPGLPFAATVTSSDVFYPGIQGKAAEFDPVLVPNAVHRIINDELAFLSPELVGPLVFRADIFDDGVTEFKRVTVNVRYQLPGSGAQNVIQVGITPQPGGFGHMQAGMLFNPEPGWRPISLPEEMNERVEIGPGWHRFMVHITMTELIYSLDLHRDGTVDAVDIVPALLHPIGFNEMRFGKMLGPEPSFIAIDNLVLRAIPEPATAGLAGMAGLALVMVRSKPRAPR
jgi:hypothetical protein